MPEKFEDATITGHFDHVSEEKSVTEIMIIMTSSPFSKSSFPRMFSVHAKPSFSLETEFLRFDERFRKPPFS